MSKILEIQDLNINISSKNIVKNLDMHIKQGQTVALVGESGSGKSITAHSILKLLPSEITFSSDSKILFENKDILQFTKKDLLSLRGSKISMIFQEPMSALNPLHKVNKQISEIIEIHKVVSKKQLNKEVLELLEKVELNKYLDVEKIANSYPHELSGGQRQRVMIAMAIANNPKLLIADEPTTALDVTTQYQILNLLKKLQDEYKMSILLITHDLSVVKKYADYIYVINQGKIVEHNINSEIFSNPKDSYTKLLLSSDIEVENKNKNNNEKIIEISNVDVNFPIFKGIFKRVARNFKAVNAVSLKVFKQDTFGIIGESGSGKSTLAQAIIKLIDYTGDITFLDTNLSKLTKKQLQKIRKDIQIVFQDPFNSLNPRMTIFSIISEGLDIHTTLSKQQKEKEVMNILKEVELPVDSIHRYPHEFSGGQRQRIAVARALILKPKLLILDEPTSALDRQVQFSLISLLSKLQKKYNLTYIFISHDLKLIEKICNKVAVMKKGKIVETNYTDELFLNPQDEYTKILIKASANN
ncbi:ABC transporter ATP-binding protein [Arcobacter sp. CECT 8985]|uniref:ABC transporter ATP-binding protein n=1 Tax=Arcobacter sp. CECT 8985 TaxID=1935424 RepID=UPI00100BA865|nr:dipeptide ABC transporter ATP-binding protein [Arcobacter sp. CECT 8985]RXJ86844.1 microcin ABC transporter ATP-binding protein [Arcobacter sp. CECT 8985]